MSIDFFTFGIVIDDIVFPDGTTRMGQLGGGGPQTAVGMSVWTHRKGTVGLVAGIGKDLPAEGMQYLEAKGIDLGGLRLSDLPTPRAWQILESDGRRTQVWRVPPEILGHQLRSDLNLLPADYQKVKGIHAGIHPDDPDIDWIHDLHRHADIVSIEPFKPADSPVGTEILRAVLSESSIFSPNEHEAVSLVGSGTKIHLVRKLIDMGGNIVALRLGAEGSLVTEKNSRRIYHIPAVPVEVIDPIGAGNAFCGGFLTGWAETGDLLIAGCRGSVSASFMLEQVGLPGFSADFNAILQERLEQITPLVQKIND
jgi:sugar/nucleoside kinase (ribokinase family)